MPTSVPGSSRIQRQGIRRRGFTLLELLVVVAIVAVATAGVAFALRDAGASGLEREGRRLAALLEAGRAQSRMAGVPVHWRPAAGGFRFEGLPHDALPQHWLDPGTLASGPSALALGPEPLIGPQAITLTHPRHPGAAVQVATDGLRPFQVAPATP